MKRLHIWIALALFISLCYSCTKHTFTVSGNAPPVSNNISTVKVENYVNRLFIDLIGREPLEEELSLETDMLLNEDLKTKARTDLIKKLQTTEATSYREAYHQHLYKLAKIRLLEGASDATIAEFIQGNDDLEAVVKLEAVLEAVQDLEATNITFDELQARMIDNEVYDAINMNTSNFVNATFDNLLWRFPTIAEYDYSYRMIEYEEPLVLFGEEGENKTDYIRIFSNTKEYFEGIIIWAFQTSLSRRPTTFETVQLLDDYFEHRDFRKVQQYILSLDEYANF